MNRTLIGTTVSMFVLGSRLLLAEQIPVALTLPTQGGSNTLDITADGVATIPPEVPLSDTQSTQLSGNIDSILAMEFDTLTHEVASVQSLEFTGGDVSIGDTEFTFDFGLLGSITAEGTGLGATLQTPNPPGAVNVDQTFDTADHELILNQGNLDVDGSGAVGDVLAGPINVSLASDPVVTTTTAQGTISAELNSVVGDDAVYDVTVSIPVDFDEPIDGLPDGISVDLQAVGTVEATGQFIRVIPEPRTGLLCLLGLWLLSLLGAVAGRRCRWSRGCPFA